MRTIRAFIAINLPSSIRSLLNDTQDELRKQLPARTIRWVPIQNIHLTLKFLGDIQEDRLPSISRELDLVTKDHSPFNLDLGHLGCFPNPKKPRVVWIGIQGETKELMVIQQRIEGSLRRLGWEAESRKFHPHLTLGRVRDSRQLAVIKLPWGHQIHKEGFIVDSITLFESQLQSGGARYLTHYTSKLSSFAK